MVRTFKKLPPEYRNARTWNYCLPDEHLFCEFKDKSETLEKVLQFSRLRVKVVRKTSLFGWGIRMPKIESYTTIRSRALAEAFMVETDAICIIPPS
jgi:hypothetical protein